MSQFEPVGLLRPGDLLTTAEIAELFKVDTKTILRWEKAGRLTAVRLPGGHKRFTRADADALIQSGLGRRATNRAEDAPGQLDLTAPTADVTEKTKPTHPKRRATDNPARAAS